MAPKRPERQPEADRALYAIGYAPSRNMQLRLARQGFLAEVQVMPFGKKWKKLRFTLRHIEPLRGQSDPLPELDDDEGFRMVMRTTVSRDASPPEDPDSIWLHMLRASEPHVTPRTLQRVKIKDGSGNDDDE